MRSYLDQSFHFANLRSREEVIEKSIAAFAPLSRDLEYHRRLPESYAHNNSKKCVRRSSTVL